MLGFLDNRRALLSCVMEALIPYAIKMFILILD